MYHQYAFPGSIIVFIILYFIVKARQGFDIFFYPVRKGRRHEAHTMF